MKTPILLASALLVTMAALIKASLPAIAQDVESRMLELEKELMLIKAELASQAEQSKKVNTKNYGSPRDQYEMKGPTPMWGSADGRYKMEINGRIHYDFGLFSQDDDTTGNVEFPDLNSGSNFRRGRIGLKGVIDKEWAYNITFDLGESSDSGNVDTDVVYLQYKGIKPLQFTLGKHKVPHMMGVLTSSNDIAFIERAQVANIMTTSVLRGQEIGEKRIGFSVGAGGYNYSARFGLFSDNENFNDGDAALSAHGRLTFAPISDEDKAVHFGISGWHLFEPPQDESTSAAQTVQLRDRPEFRVDGDRLIDTGAIGGNVDEGNMVAFELAGKFGPAWMMAEYATVEYDINGTNGGTFSGIPRFHGYYISGGYFLTGESRKYSARSGKWKGITVKNPFTAKNGTGAWELLGRHSSMNLNAPASRIEGGKQQNYTIGLRWWVNNWVNFGFNYIHANVDKQTATNSGVEEGQEFDIFAFRSAVKW